MNLKDRLALVVLWLKGEPVILRYLAAVAVTSLARWGINLDADATAAVGAAAAALAAWSARQTVSTPATVARKIDAAYLAGRQKQAKPKV